MVEIIFSLKHCFKTTSIYSSNQNKKGLTIGNPIFSNSDRLKSQLTAAQYMCGRMNLVY